MNVLASLRQRRFPAEFRIAPPGPVPDEVPEPPAVAPVPADPSDLSDRDLCEIVTQLWRTTRKIDDRGGAADVPRNQRQANRHLRQAWDRLAEAGIRVKDYDGARFDPGLDLEVIAYQEEPGVVGQTVLETVRPAVVRGGRRIQAPQVIVAIPTKETAHGDLP
ncbi:hypothetical protein [Glycomyces artemisiae]|uniref:Nucleotide exchange factor GrpE n=1 Tax=Glycomyces artemisiae TaxID=1076443 RepID=A0A2T0UP03_9ACTN|nr:hypothetical protein [Glycomyces artemisiae]PRY59651.1 hypothetical protein B0I28_103125 [Glycomyces artemisiae]